MGAAIEGLFYQFVQKLCELGEVKYEDVFVDGTKIEAAANRYTFVWKKAVKKNEEKMLLKVQALTEEIVKIYHVELTVSKETVSEDMVKMAGFLEKKKTEENIEFVYGNCMAAASVKAIFKNCLKQQLFKN